jgi:hypothetical protein
MKYYSNIIFWILNSLYFLAIISTIFVACIFIFIAMWAGHASQIKNEIISASIGIIIFLLISTIVLFLQQLKIKCFGYFMLVLLPVGLYIFYKIYSYLPIINLTTTNLFNIGMIPVSLLWIGINIIIALTALIPFYVLGKLIKEDFFKKNKN